MKKTIAAILILAVGVLIGKTIFGGKSSELKTNATTTQVEEHWTCSMHPQIDLPGQTPCPICGMDLILKEDGGGEQLDPNQFKMNDYAMALADIQTQVVGDEEIDINETDHLQLSGRIIQNENNVALQTAHVGGRIEKLFFKTEGEYIQKGKVIALIYSPDLVTAQNELIQALEIKSSQPELYLSIRKKLQHWKLTEAQIQKVEQTKGVMTNYPLIANVNGIITKKYVDEGNHVMEGSKMYDVTNLSSLWAEFDVFERDLKHVSKWNKIIISPNAYPSKNISSKINFIDPILNPNTRTIKVRATIKNNKNLLKPGMILSGKLARKAGDGSESVLLVPKTSVLWTGKRSIVYLKPFKDQSVFELRTVELGAESGDQYEIISGIERGDEVVVNGTFTLDAAAQLNNKASMMNVIEDETKEVEKLPDYTSSTASQFKQQLGSLSKSYISLKDALVKTSSNEAAEAAKNFIQELNKVDMGLLKGKAHVEWMTVLNALKTHGGKIIKLDDVEEQRQQFDFLSQSLINSIKIFGVEGSELYVQHCPMAFDNQGADWLSNETSIFNPYFGDKMLKCGIVKDTLSKER